MLQVEAKKRKRDQYKENKHMARDVANVKITAVEVFGNSAPGSSLKKLRSDKNHGGPPTTAKPMQTPSASGHQATNSETIGMRETL